MAKELPYFKYYPGEWIKGDITICTMAAQGLFINICSYYWSKKGTLTLAGIQQRFNTCSTEIDELINNKIMTVSKDKITIKFLDEQLNEFGELRKKKSRAGHASARSRKGNTRSTPVQQVYNKREGELEGEGEGEGELNTLSDPPGPDLKNIKSVIQIQTGECLPFARTLARIVQSQKNIDISSTKKQSWANEIRKLVFTSEKVGKDRVEKALMWYRKNVGGEYVPVIESGKSLREKFTKLEAAIERDKSPKRKNNRDGPRHGVRDLDFDDVKSTKIKIKQQ